MLSSCCRGLGWKGGAVKKKISRREFLSSAVVLLFSAATAGKFGLKVSTEENTDKPVITRTSRKKADYYRELAG